MKATIDFKTPEKTIFAQIKIGDWFIGVSDRLSLKITETEYISFDGNGHILKQYIQEGEIYLNSFVMVNVKIKVG